MATTAAVRLAPRATAGGWPSLRMSLRRETSAVAGSVNRPNVNRALNEGSTTVPQISRRLRSPSVARTVLRLDCPPNGMDERQPRTNPTAATSAAAMSINAKPSSLRQLVAVGLTERRRERGMNDQPATPRTATGAMNPDSRIDTAISPIAALDASRARRRPPCDASPTDPTNRHKTIAVYAQTSVMKLAASGAQSGPSSVVRTPAIAIPRTVALRN